MSWPPSVTRLAPERPSFLGMLGPCPQAGHGKSAPRVKSMRMSSRWASSLN
jgi:hypothetical protein